MNILKIIKYAWTHDKISESNQQMRIRICIKFLILSIIILMFDWLLDFLLGVIHSIFELIHLLIKVIEHPFTIIFKQTIQLDHRQSEIIIVNLVIIVIFLYSFYYLYQFIPKLCCRIKRKILTLYFKCIKRELVYWKSLTLRKKTNLIMYYFAGFSSILFLFI